MRSMIIHALDIHSTITPEGEHGDRLSGYHCDHPSGVAHQLGPEGGSVQGSAQGSPHKIALARLGLLAAAAILFIGTTLYWSFKRKAATHSIKAAPSTLRMRYAKRSTDRPPYAAKPMTPVEWRTGSRTYTARWPRTDKPGSSMGSTFSSMPPANTGMSAVQWHMFGLRKTTAPGGYTTAVATAAPARSGLISSARSRRAQPGMRAPSVKGSAMVNTYSLSCSSDTDAGLGLATADKQRAGLVGNQIAPRLPLTDYREEAPVGVDTAVPVASGNALEGAAAHMQDSSPQIIRGAAGSSKGKWKNTMKVSMKGKLKGSLKSLKIGVKRHLCSSFIPSDSAVVN
ncbi:TPA: hypothetical protein ACH3X3_007538 [Trebouxia sp. C0006]